MTRDAIAIHTGDTIHVQPHDVWARTGKPLHTHIDATVLVTGTECGVVVYDWDAPVELDGHRLGR